MAEVTWEVMHSDAKWCMIWVMSAKGHRKQRLSIQLEPADFERIVELAEGHSPRVSRAHVVEAAVKHFLALKNPQLLLGLGGQHPERGRNDDQR